jgi:hypothetical protein
MSTSARRQQRIHDGLCQICGHPSTVRSNGQLAKTCLFCTRIKSLWLKAQEQAEARGNAVVERRVPVRSACLLCGKVRLSMEPTDRYHETCRRRAMKLSRDLADELPL